MNCRLWFCLVCCTVTVLHAWEKWNSTLITQGKAKKQTFNLFTATNNNYVQERKGAP